MNTDDTTRDISENTSIEPEETGKPRELRVGFAGEGPMLDAVAAAYKNLPGVASTVLFRPGRKKSDARSESAPTAYTAPDYSTFVNMVDAVEVFDVPGDHASFIVDLLRDNRHVSVNKPYAHSLEEVDRMILAAEKYRVRLRFNEYPIFYAPYIKLRELLHTMEIGEVCAARFHSNLCGSGGWGPETERFKSAPSLLHPAFDRFALMEFLLGEAAAVTAYIDPVHPKHGGRALVGFRCAAPGCYGHLECVFAPQTAIRSTGVPCDDSIEIAGSDGIVWVRHFHGKMTEEPNIEVRRGKKHYILGVAEGMRVDWEDALRASSRDFVDSLLAGKQPSLNGVHARRALRFLLSAVEAADKKCEISL